jgi:hypothetical protein
MTNMIVGVAVALLLLDIFYLGRFFESLLPGMGGLIQFIFGLFCIFLIVAYTIWPLLYMFIESGIPSIFYGLQDLFAPIQQFQSYLTPEYWTFSQRQSSVYEQTTDDAGVPPNIDFTISTFQVKPSSNVVFGQSVTLWMTVENVGDQDLDVKRGFRSGWIGQEVDVNYPCPCEILRVEPGGWDYDTEDELQMQLRDNCIENVFDGNPELDVDEEEYRRFWIADIEGEHAPLMFSDCGVIGQNCVEWDPFCYTSCGSRPGRSCEDWFGQGYDSYYECRDDCLVASCGCDRNAISHGCCYYTDDEVTVRRGLPRNDYCTDVVYQPRHWNLSTETCQIEAYAQADLHSSSILAVQVVNSSYFFQRGLVPTIVPSVASTGAVITSISVGEQPLLDIEPNIILTIGIENGRSGLIRDLYNLYFFIPPGLSDACGGGESFVCGGKSLCSERIGNWDTPSYFVTECESLVDDGYTVCNLKTSGDNPKDIITSYLLTNGFVSAACTLTDVDLKLDDVYRKSHMFRADTFYRYEVKSAANLNGLKIG